MSKNLMNAPNFSYQSVFIFRGNQGTERTDIKNAIQQTIKDNELQNFDITTDIEKWWIRANKYSHKEHKKLSYKLQLMKQRSKEFNEYLDVIHHSNLKGDTNILLPRFIKKSTMKIRVKVRGIFKAKTSCKYHTKKWKALKNAYCDGMSHYNHTNTIKYITVNIPCTEIRTSFVAYLKQVPDIFMEKYNAAETSSYELIRELGHKFNVSKKLIKLVEDEMTEVTNCDEDTYLDSWVKRLLSKTEEQNG